MDVPILRLNSSIPIPFHPRLWAAGIFVVVAAVAFGIFALFGQTDASALLLSIWLSSFVLYGLYKSGFFAQRVPLRLQGAQEPVLERLRRTSGRSRFRPAGDAIYISADEANESDSEVQPEDRVIGLVIDDYAIAYPLAAMSFREVAHEAFGDLHVFVTWWPVTYSARAFVFEGEAGKEPELRTQRKTTLNSTAMVDENGDTVIQFIGQKVTGAQVGADLEQTPLVMTSWRAWSEAHPHTEVMSLEGGPGEDIFERYYITDRAGIHQQSASDKRWHDKDVTLGLEINGEAKAYPYPALIATPLIQEELGGEPVIVLQERASATAAAFSRKLGDRVLTFTPDSKNPMRPEATPVETSESHRARYEPWMLKDDQTGSLWRAVAGRCISGPLEGESLKMLPAQTGFWFAWSRFYPNAQVVEPTQAERD